MHQAIAIKKCCIDLISLQSQIVDTKLNSMFVAVKQIAYFNYYNVFEFIQMHCGRVIMYLSSITTIKNRFMNMLTGFISILTILTAS